MRARPLAAAAAAVAAAAALTQAPPPPGAAACSGCHPAASGGAGGAAAVVPPIEGRPAGEIVAAMLAYRAGERGPTVMDRIAKGFTDDEIRAIAGWLEGRGG